MADRIQIRRGTAAEWLLSDPILAQGELGLETDTRNFKAGDGTNTWSALPNLFSQTTGFVKITQADFADATHYNSARIAGKTLAVFFNDANKYLDEGPDYVTTGGGINVLIAGFNATTNNYKFIIHYE